jgi:hypothetical protein
MPWILINGAIARGLEQIDPALLQMFIEKFQKLNPDLTGPISVKESVQAQLKVIGDLDAKTSGMFLSHMGNTQWV